ncbi:Potassium channel [Micromonospora saelicesensis]|uniref:Potassium channel n=1 Tax=Micromonospora saelicesensis TaxID=285676 RepID=A0ABX9CDN9_9ACTN|nr:Potassium channel [Micromonospora saelicesensis]RAO59373.1 Potassium channel [Micromonospora saelicesensis]
MSATDRMTAFSDGVFAIVITLLVIELRVPEYHEGELLTGLLGEGASYLAFVVSFVYIGVLWLNHHALLRLIRGTTLTLSWINLGVLFGAVIIPFPTAVLASAFTHGDTDDQRAAVALYALAAALMSAPWLVFFGYLHRHPALLERRVSPEYVRTQRLRPVTGLILYGLSGLLGWFVSPLLGLIGVIVMIIYHAVTSEGLPRWLTRR